MSHNHFDSLMSGDREFGPNPFVGGAPDIVADLYIVKVLPNHVSAVSNIPLSCIALDVENAPSICRQARRGVEVASRTRPTPSHLANSIPM